MIQLTENLAVTADDLQYIVGRPIQRERNGSQVIEIRRPRYCPTLAGAVKYAVDQALRDKVAADEITTLQEFLMEHKQIDKAFRKLLEPLE